jgi:hypothetical protein
MTNGKQQIQSAWGNVFGGGFPELPRIKEINEKADSARLAPHRTLVALASTTGDIFITRYNWPPLPPMKPADACSQVLLHMIEGTKRANIVLPIKIVLFDDSDPVKVVRGMITETLDALGLSKGTTLEWDV